MKSEAPTLNPKPQAYKALHPQAPSPYAGLGPHPGIGLGIYVGARIWSPLSPGGHLGLMVEGLGLGFQAWSARLGY